MALSRVSGWADRGMAPANLGTRRTPRPRPRSRGGEGGKGRRAVRLVEVEAPAIDRPFMRGEPLGDDEIFRMTSLGLLFVGACKLAN